MNYKLDPHLNKPIKAYVEFLDALVQSDNEGYVKFPEDLAQSSASNSLWKESGFGNNTNDILEFTKKVGLASDDSMGKLYALLNAFDDPANLSKVCSSLVESIQEEESRAYYVSRLNSFTGEFNLEDEGSRESFSVVFSLTLRYLFDALQGDEIKPADDDMEHFVESGANVTLLKFITHTASQLAFKRSPEGLLRNVTSGDDKALFKAVTIDKTILSNVYVKQRIEKAQVIGDSKFFSKLGRAVSRNPLKHTEQHGKVFAVLQTFWYAGLYRLTYVELHSFLETCGLIPPDYPVAFEKFMARYKPFFEG